MLESCKAGERGRFNAGNFLAGQRARRRFVPHNEVLAPGRDDRPGDFELTEFAPARVASRFVEQPQLRQHIAGADVQTEAERLPAAAPSQDFTARTMARVRTRRPPRRSVWTWLRAPALSPLTALAGAAAVAVGAFGLAGWHRGAPGEHTPPAISRSVAQEVVTRLAYRAPLAREVAVAGDFNGWDPQAARMRRGQGGVWSVEIPVSPGRRYQYMFIVDGRWVTDPDAPASVDDGFGGRNAVLDL